jgi:hypothetical protein
MDGSTGETLKSVIGNTPIDALDAIPDIVGDNSMELVVGGRSGGVVCLSGGYDTTIIAVPGYDNLHPKVVHAYPNPCNDLLYVNVDLMKSSKVTITVAGITGNVVYTSAHENESPGKHVFVLTRDLFTGSVPAGVCIVRVNTAEGIRHCKVVFR